MTSVCRDGQYAAFNVNNMHICKNYILFPIKSNQTNTQFKEDHQPKKSKRRKLLFSRKYFLIGQPIGKVTLVCGQICLLALLQARFHAVGDGGVVSRETHWCAVNGDVAFDFRAGGKTGATDIGSSSGAAIRVVEGPRAAVGVKHPFRRSL